MDGKQLRRQLSDVLNESSISGWLDDFTSYQNLWLAAIEFVSRTGCMKSSQSIPMVPLQSQYTLNADFLKIYAKTDDNRYFLKLTDGAGGEWYLWEKDYNEILYETTQDAVEYPYNFAVIDGSQAVSNKTGTATSNGTSVGGECTLTDNLADFSLLAAGDSVHNNTDGSTGIVLSVTSSTAIVTALFGGTANDWTSGDSYAVVPKSRSVIVIDPPPSVDSVTLTVPYVQRPIPVFSDYGTYRFQHEYNLAIIMYAAWLYKYRDSAPNMGDKFFVHFDNQVKRYCFDISSRFRNNRRMKVNMKVRS